MVQKKDIRKMAVRDFLTGLYNRAFLEEMRDQLDKEALWVMFVDVDDLKAINDTKGHEAGDRALRSQPSPSS